MIIMIIKIIVTISLILIMMVIVEVGLTCFLVCTHNSKFGSKIE